MAIQFTTTPQNAEIKIARVQDAISQLPAFNDIYWNAYQSIENGTFNGDENQLAAWRKDYREGIINVGGKIVDIDFFRNMMGGQTREINATDYYIRYDDAVDFNVYAQNDATGTYGAVTGCTYEKLQDGTYTGNYAQFNPAINSYESDGTISNVFEGLGLYIMNDQQEVVVIKVDRTTAFSWLVTVAPLNDTYIPQIYALEPMAIRPAARTTGFSGAASVPVNTPWTTPGFIDKVQPCEFYRTWEYADDLDRGYQDVIQFAILFDNVTKQPVTTWYFKNANEARNDIKMATTCTLFMGQKVTNDALSSHHYTQKYNGFDGLQPKIFYGGGNIYPVDNTYGWSLDYDYMNIVFANDALKKSDEMLMLKSKKFGWNLEGAANRMFQANSGSCTFQTFERLTKEGDDIRRYKVDSYYYSNNTLHTREVDAFSDSRFIGHHYLKDYAFLLPGYGMTDSMGEQVGPVEFYRQMGQMMSSEFDEKQFDNRTTPGMETKWSGNIRSRIQMAVHGVQNMWALPPMYATV